MDVARQYVISVMTAAVFCGIVNAVIRKGPAHTLVKLLCGLFLAFSFLRPLPELSLEILVPELPEGAAEQMITEGRELATGAMSQIISERTREYIMEKAASLGASVEVEVTVSDEQIPVPTGVRIIGSVAPYIRSQLQQYITHHLGIGEEAQEWTVRTS